jgi:hypothetical protein
VLNAGSGFEDMNIASTGLDSGEVVNRLCHGLSDGFGLGRQGRQEDRDQCVDVGLLGDEADSLCVLLGGGRREHVHGVCNAGFGRQELAQYGLCHLR